jgi:hypothetical protein
VNYISTSADTYERPRPPAPRPRVLLAAACGCERRSIDRCASERRIPCRAEGPTHRHQDVLSKAGSSGRYLGSRTRRPPASSPKGRRRQPVHPGPRPVPSADAISPVQAQWAHVVGGVGARRAERYGCAAHGACCASLRMLHRKRCAVRSLPICVCALHHSICPEPPGRPDRLRTQSLCVCMRACVRACACARVRARMRCVCMCV